MHCGAATNNIKIRQKIKIKETKLTWRISAVKWTVVADNGDIYSLRAKKRGTKYLITFK